MLGFNIVDVGPEVVVVVHDARLAAAIREFAYFWEECASKREDPAGDLARMTRLMRAFASEINAVQQQTS